MHGRIRKSITAIGTILILALVGLGITVRTGHLSLMPVLSGSMAPTAPTGDLAVLWQVPTSSLKVGDVVTFYPPGDTSVAKMHRIVVLARAGDKTTITTKGDANRIADPWGKVVLKGTTAYRMVAVVPLLGWTAALGRWWIPLVLIAAGVLLGIATLQDLRRRPASKQPNPAMQGGGAV
ncbi:MAG: signal peptidase I [Candidatus Dormiibacterota bacterium]